MKTDAEPADGATAGVVFVLCADQLLQVDRGKLYLARRDEATFGAHALARAVWACHRHVRICVDVEILLRRHHQVMPA